MLYEAWAVPSTYSGITKPAIGQAFSFPLSLYLPPLLRYRNIQRCERSGISTPQHAERAARSCLAALEARLAATAAAAAADATATGGEEGEGEGEGVYFFGSKPSALDATVYGYIETIYRSPYNGCVRPNQPTNQPLN